jgi:ATP-binding cassette subfamily F protein 3
VAQEAPATADSLLDTVLAADTERAALLAEAETATDPARIAEIQTRLADIDAHSAEARAASILNGLGFDAEAQARPCAEFSGGWRMRVALAAVLFARPDLLLLDEPTNYLDLEGAMWLESFLARYPATALVISHDRGLLNRAVGGILHLENRKLSFTNAPFDEFDRMRREKLAHARAAADKQAAQRAISRNSSTASATRPPRPSRRRAASRCWSAWSPSPSTRPARSPPSASPSRRNSRRRCWRSTARPSAMAARRSEGSVAALDPDDRIALLGANGQGKSTLAKLIAGRLEAMAGAVTARPSCASASSPSTSSTIWSRARRRSSISSACAPRRSPRRSARRLAAGGIGADIADVEVTRLSGGQRARLLMALMAHRRAASADPRRADQPSRHGEPRGAGAGAQRLSGRGDPDQRMTRIWSRRWPTGCGW